MKRKHLLASSIFALIGFAISTILFIYLTLYYIRNEANWAYILELVFNWIVSLSALLFAICILLLWNKPSEIYNKNKIIIITAIILYIISIIISYAFYSKSLIVYTPPITIFFYFVILLIVPALVLLIFGYIDAEKSNKAEKSKQEIKQKVVERKSDFENNIERINALKEKGLINEEEYAKLKSNYINQHLEKN